MLSKIIALIIVLKYWHAKYRPIVEVIWAVGTNLAHIYVGFKEKTNHAIHPFIHCITSFTLIRCRILNRIWNGLLQINFYWPLQTANIIFGENIFYNTL